jgi:hypothetical protein
MNTELDFDQLSCELTEIQEIMNSIDDYEGLLVADGEDRKNKIYLKILKKIDNLSKNLKESNICISGFAITFSPILINSTFSINFEIKE